MLKHTPTGLARPFEGDIEDLVVGSRSPLQPGGFVLGDVDRKHRLDLPRRIVTRHLLLLGPSGSGKSRGFFMENCARGAQGSLIVSDPKGDLWRTTSRLLPAPLRFAPREPDASGAFNWIPLCRDPAMALRIGRALLGTLHLEASPPTTLQITLAASLFQHVALLPVPTPASAFDLLTGSSPRRLLTVLAKSDAEAARRYAAVVALAGRDALHAAVVGLAQRLIFLADPEVRRFTSARCEAPDFTALRRAPTAVFWIVREEDMAALRPLTAVFFTTVLQACKRSGAAVPVTFFLDEFANVCDVPDFETEITIARGQDIAFVVSLQSISQLEKRYGKASANTIYENCQTTIVLPGLSSSSAQLIARTLGTNGSKATVTTADEIRCLGDKEMLVIMTNHAPFRLRRRKYTSAPSEAHVAPLGPGLSTTAEDLAARPVKP